VIPTPPPDSSPTVLSLGELLRQNPTTPPGLIEPGLLPHQGILFVGGEPKVGKSLLVANLALVLASGTERAGFPVPVSRRVLVCQFELPVPQFTSRLAQMRQPLGSAADDNLFVDTRATGHLLSSSHGLAHFLAAAHRTRAEVIVFDPLYSTHDQDENDTRAMAALCQSLLRLRDQSQAALIVVHHTRKTVARHEIGSAFRGSSALHAVGDSYLLLTRPSAQLTTLELRFQFRYAPLQPPRLLTLDPKTLWFSASGLSPPPAQTLRKVESVDVERALAVVGPPAGFNQLRQQIIEQSTCSKRTAQLAIARARQDGVIVHDQGRYHLPLATASQFVTGSRR
jgi:hypothetical protein